MNFRSEHRVQLLSNPFTSREDVSLSEEIYAELFYDLFFVAALTTFGVKHEITQDQAIATYVAFFAILWYYLLSLLSSL